MGTTIGNLEHLDASVRKDKSLHLSLKERTYMTNIDVGTLESMYTTLTIMIVDGKKFIDDPNWTVENARKLILGYDHLQKDNDRLRSIVESLTERIAVQSELLSKVAEKIP